MKKLVLISAIVLGGLYHSTANAQIRLHFGFNFGTRPVYVQHREVIQQPVEYSEPVNYNGDEDYYYLPEVDAYYSVSEQSYYYMDGDQWISAAYLPGAYRDYDWRSARRYEVRAPRPYMHDDYYRTRFGGVADNHRWERNDRSDRGGYANADRYNHDQYRNNGQTYDRNRMQNENHQQFDQNFNRGNSGGQYQNQNFDRGNRGGQPSNQNFDRGNRGGQDNQSRNMGAPTQKDYGNRGNAEQHFAQNNRPGSDNRVKPNFKRGMF